MKDFDKLVLDSLDSLIVNVFGKHTSAYILNPDNKSGPQNFDDKSLENTINYLERVFGSKVSNVLYSACIKQVYVDLQQEYKEVEKYFDVLDAIYKTKFDIVSHKNTRESNFMN